MLDDAASESLNALADRVAEDLGLLREAIDRINEGTYSEISRNRRRAKKLLVGAWNDIAGVVRALSEPVPAYRVGVGNPMPCPRGRQVVDEVVADFQPASLPAPLEVAL
jgi:hypothetical protein